MTLALGGIFQLPVVMFALVHIDLRRAPRRSAASARTSAYSPSSSAAS
jgi:Sec-independent protein secretion pathway component TatC